VFRAAIGLSRYLPFQCPILPLRADAGNPYFDE
jgi:hypothetical protein